MKNGSRYTITLRGQAIAELIPADLNKQHNAILAVARMQAFVAKRLVNKSIDVKALIEEGRD